MDYLVELYVLAYFIIGLFIGVCFLIGYVAMGDDDLISDNCIKAACTLILFWPISTLFCVYGCGKFKRKEEDVEDE